MLILFKFISHLDQTKDQHLRIEIGILAVTFHFAQDKLLGTFRVKTKSTCENKCFALWNQTHSEKFIFIKAESIRRCFDYDLFISNEVFDIDVAVFNFNKFKNRMAVLFQNFTQLQFIIRKTQLANQ
ncbi:hypothetical protein D3C87_1834940 [compost metagenome]